MAAAPVTIPGGAKWSDVVADRRRHRDETIAAVCPPIPQLLTDEIPLNVTSIPRAVLSPEEIAITESTVEALVVKLASATWSAKQVVNAFLRRAGLAQKLTNCVTELLPEAALQRAAELDEYLALHKKPIGPLHGVPISVKEHVAMKDLDLNAGFVSWVGRTASQDAYILQILWQAGAIFYVRSTQPQTLMHLEASSSLYGVTVNPFNTTLTSGGSSGGEGALLGMRASVLGVGTDIGGSIRSPAANNGVFGFKPTSKRLPTMGMSATMLEAEAINCAIGPLSTSLEGIKLFTKTLIDAKPWLKEPPLVALDWRDPSTYFPEKKLKVGVMWDDGIVKPHPPITRALTNLVNKLKESKAVDVVEWKPYKHDLAWSIIANLYFLDGGNEETAAIDASGEPWMPLSRWIITDNPHLQHHTIASLWESCSRRDQFREKYAEIWNENPVDVILCPVGPGVAPKLDTSKYWAYTAVWNLLDYPAVVFPVNDAVSVEKDGANVDYMPTGDKDEFNWSLWKEHGAEGYKDAPITLQLVGRRCYDEKLMGALEILLSESGLPLTC